ncbi:hypothetical protein O9X98_10705 [Agrobacterium salinitolerans]|nr:hypothetical protein [Agrobacterium salinitolerans]
MISLTRLVALLCIVFAAAPVLAQDKETPQAQRAGSEEGELPRAEKCWPTRNVYSRDLRALLRLLQGAERWRQYSTAMKPRTPTGQAY